jgi:hypothetical protein
LMINVNDKTVNFFLLLVVPFAPKNLVLPNFFPHSDCFV